MRPSSVISFLAVAAYSLPLPPFNDSLLDNIQDLIYKSVNGLLYPFGLYGQHDCQPFSYNFDSKFCVAQCVPNCSGSAQKCSDCLIGCYRENSCYGGQGDDKANNPQAAPAAPNDPQASPAPAPPAPEADPSQ
ncbi:hypothetical protein O1611_g3798 [Lasiodiplodia mahajangana]|uniref:Uncharacterized protein n=1 Tax=Lasiodiplodia mahajangana TaxID=1108764 RepID=A0ACC2JRL0_9PEZI|nr:hypothetical protein O1611_g3798 [Lasiodiplodia mahajangana]